MHGGGSGPSTPASFAVGRGRDAADRASVSRLAASCPVDFPTRVDAAQIGLTRAVSAETAEMAGSSRNG